METKNNVAAILKDKPQGTKLYDLLYNIDVELDTINTTDTETIVLCINETDNNTICYHGYSEFGTERCCPDSLQILLPSKEMRDWRKFAWKKGDVLVSKDNVNVYVIFEKFEDDAYTRFKCKHCLIKDSNEEYYSKEDSKMLTSLFKKANDDEAQTYISNIEERLGGKLNRETLEIEKTQPEFKDGDVVVVDEIPFDLYSKCIFILKENLNPGEIKARAYVLYNVNKDSIFFDTPIMKVIERNIHLATDEEKQQLFSALEKEGKAWDSEHKMIVDSKPKVEFKPFDKVLVRDNDTQPWMPAFFEREYKHKFFLLSGFCFNQCIPYIGNESLLGTTKDVEG